MEKFDNIIIEFLVMVLIVLGMVLITILGTIMWNFHKMGCDLFNGMIIVLFSMGALAIYVQIIDDINED